MTVTSAVSRSNYIGSGLLNIYDYTFRIFAESDLRVVILDLNRTENTLVLNTDYTVSGVGIGSGGSITLIDLGQTWMNASGFLITDAALAIRRVRPVTQETDIRNQGKFYPETHEDAFDHAIMVMQQFVDAVERCIIIGEAVDLAAFDTTLPVPSADDLIQVNATATGFQAVSFAEVLSSATILSGLLSARPAAPARPIFYEATDIDQIFYYSVSKGAWRAAF